jgi:hypothetical protein
MTIPFKNVDAILFLAELNLQCDFAERAATRLQLARAGWLKEAPGSVRMPPIEIFEACHQLLLASGVISKILFGVGVRAQKRGKLLRELMLLPELPLLAKRSVRNSYEHVDERLDKMAHKFLPGVKISPLSVSDNKPEPDEIVLKRFSPKDMRIYFSEQFVDLMELINEIGSVRGGVNVGMANLNECSEKVL